VGWLIVTVAIPVLLPVGLLLLVKMTPAGSHLNLMDSLKDGQLSWFAITLSCSTFYDLIQNDGSAQRLAWCGALIGGMAGIGLLSGVHAVAAALKPTPLLTTAPPAGQPQARVWIRHYRVFVISAGLSVLAAVASLAVHNLLP
jgi:hypothetical protein